MMPSGREPPSTFNIQRGNPLQGSLTVYESILGAMPEARLHFLDDLVERRNKSKLPAYIASEKKGCE